MRFIAWTMLVVFALGGSFCVLNGLRSLIVAIRRRPHLRRVQGTVMTIHTTRETRTDAEGRRMRTYVKFHPEIQFTTELGQVIRFRSELGESHVIRRKRDGTSVEPVSSYRAGQTLDVFHDPAGALPPCIATWAGLYGPGTALAVAGAGFLGASALIWGCFGQKLLGR